MSNVTETTKTTTESSSHHVDMSDTYLRVFIALAVLTLIEVIAGSVMGTSPAKVAILLVFAVAKIALITAIFMHVKYDKNPAQIVIFSFIVPLIGAIVLSSVIWADYRPI